MRLITFSGPCGSGKSTLAYLLEGNFKRVETTYKDCNGVSMCPNSYESKIDYTIKWFEEIMVQYYIGTEVLISDRSPFDCIAYLKENQKKYQYEVNQQFKQLNKIGIDLTKILVIANKDKLKQRIINRDRKQSILTNEIADLEFSLEYYYSIIAEFDFVIDSSYLTPTEIKNRLLRYMTPKVTTANIV